MVNEALTRIPPFQSGLVGKGASKMATLSHQSRTRALVSIAAIAAAFAAVPALAVPVVTEANTDFSTKPVTFGYQGSSFTFSGTGDFPNLTAVQTAGGGEISATTIFGLAPSSQFYPERGGDISFGPGIFGSFSEFTSPTPVPYSNGGNVFGLVAIASGLSYYGFALTQDNTLVSYGFENVANTAIEASAEIKVASAAPEPGAWAMMVLGFGLAGGAMRYSYRKSEKNFTRKTRSPATA